MSLWRASFHVFVQKSPNDCPNFRSVRFQREVARVIKAHIRVRNVALPGLRTGGQEERVVLAPHGLMDLALELRENAKSLLNAAKLGERADASVVNHILDAGRASTELKWDSASTSFIVVRRRPNDDAVSLLEPIAQAIVDLLLNTPLELVRKCEACDCTLLFHDKTKAHRRRWCSMALCGNRMKVAAFRSRKKAD